jgi:protoporphyrinogen oxidase
MSDQDAIEFTLNHLSRMFPKFQRSWLIDAHVWRAKYSQPIVECNYSRLIPGSKTSVKGLYVATMAQIYPEDRGTNYAIRQGLEIASLLCGDDP